MYPMIIKYLPLFAKTLNNITTFESVMTFGNERNVAYSDKGQRFYCKTFLLVLLLLHKNGGAECVVRFTGREYKHEASCQQKMFVHKCDSALFNSSLGLE